MEILAPAGNLKTFYVAVGSGANAVYLGLKDFSARKGADNFSYEELEEALKFARVMGVKVYVALNTLVKESELKGFLNTVITLRKMGVDAIILQDIFLGKYIHERVKDVELHLSTQGGVNNLQGAKLAKSFGFKRVILARETPIQEIKKIASFMETEVFVQGALCTSFSGHCYMSSFGGGNSGNRGLCKQPCRRTYKLNGAKENYAICTADLCVGEKIKELETIGVHSLKIEGRMRRAEYVSASIHYYRSLIYPWEKVGGELSALKRTYNRGNYTKGLAWGQEKNFLSTLIQGHIGEKIGQVKQIKGNRLFVQGNLNPQKGDAFKILRNGEEVGSADYVGEKVTSLIPLSFKGEIKVGDEVFITTDVRLNEELISPVSARILDLEIIANEGEPLVARAYADGILVGEAKTDEPLPVATTKGLTEEQVKEIFNKVDRYPFAIDNYKITLNGNLFGARSVLNALRRSLYERAYDTLSYKEEPWLNLLHYAQERTIGNGVSLAVIAENFENLSGYHLAIYAPSDYNDQRYLEKFFKDTILADERYLYIPSLLNEKDIEILSKIVVDFDGIYGENPHAITLAKEWGKKLFVGVDFNIFNSLSLSEAQKIGDKVAVSKELSLKEIKESAMDSAYIFTRGDIKVMELGYCPFGRKCADCKVKTLSTLTDYAGRKFILRRIKLSRCYFEVYNPMELVYEDAPRAIYNFVLHKGEDLKARYDATTKEYRERYETTSGHLKNPIF